MGRLTRRAESFMMQSLPTFRAARRGRPARLPLIAQFLAVAAALGRPRRRRATRSGILCLRRDRATGHFPVHHDKDVMGVDIRARVLEHLLHRHPGGLRVWDAATGLSFARCG